MTWVCDSFEQDAYLLGQSSICYNCHQHKRFHKPSPKVGGATYE